MALKTPHGLPLPLHCLPPDAAPLHRIHARSLPTETGVASRLSSPAANCEKGREEASSSSHLTRCSCPCPSMHHSLAFPTLQFPCPLGLGWQVPLCESPSGWVFPVSAEATISPFSAETPLLRTLLHLPSAPRRMPITKPASVKTC